MKRIELSRAGEIETKPKGLLLDVLALLGELQAQAEAKSNPVRSLSEPLAIRNNIGLRAGQLVRLLDPGQVVLADYRTAPATHAVGYTANGFAYLYNSWNAGPLAVSQSRLSSRDLWTGIGGSASSISPPYSDENTNYEQPIGTIIESRSAGLVLAALNILPVPMRK